MLQTQLHLTSDAAAGGGGGDGGGDFPFSLHNPRTYIPLPPPPRSSGSCSPCTAPVQAVALCPRFQPGIALAQGTFWQGVS